MVFEVRSLPDALPRPPPQPPGNPLWLGAEHIGLISVQISCLRKCTSKTEYVPLLSRQIHSCVLNLNLNLHGLVLQIGLRKNVAVMSLKPVLRKPKGKLLRTESLLSNHVGRKVVAEGQCLGLALT